MPQAWVTSQMRVNVNHQYAWAIESRENPFAPYNLEFACERCSAGFALYVTDPQQQLQQQQSGARVTREIAVHMGGQTAWSWPGVCQDCETSWTTTQQ